ncbi:JmjC domain-containing protein [Streptomyces goshikiensis]
MSSAWPPGRTFWTDTFPNSTNDRTTPFLFKGIVPADAACADDVLDGLKAMRRAHAAGTTHAARARVYVGEGRHDELIDTVLTKDRWDEGAFVPWMQSLAGADKFSLVINNLETVSPRLAAGLGAFLGSLHEGWGVPIGGSEQVAFAGNYAGTAFGVHEGAEDAFLIHLGPGTKLFYCWSAETYVRLTGSKEPVLGDYQHLLEHGECFVLEPGDALFLPRRVFHVGMQQDTFSVSVATTLYTFPVDRVLRLSVLPKLLDAVLDESTDGIFGKPSPMHAAGDGSAPAARCLTERAHAALDTIGRQLESAIAEHVENLWESTRSNGGWEPLGNDLARIQAAGAFRPEEVLPGATVSIPAPYQLRVTGAQQAFLRGTAVICDTSPLTPDLVATLNAGTPLVLPHSGALRSAITALGTTGGILLSPDTTPSEAAA